MDVKIKNYPCTVKNAYINDQCPETCYTKDKCKSIKNKCKPKAFNRCRCKNKMKKTNRDYQRRIAQKRLGILSNSQNSLLVRKNKIPQPQCEYRKPNYKEKCKNSYYNTVYKKVYDSFITLYIGNKFGRVKTSKQQITRLNQMARQYTVMWLRRYASSQGPTVDGWPATTLVGDNRNHFSEVQDGYATNCCITNKNGVTINFIKKAINDPTTFCKLTNNKKCGSLYCNKLKRLYRKNPNKYWKKR
jgi:hypothetical protein